MIVIFRTNDHVLFCPYILPQESGNKRGQVKKTAAAVSCLQKRGEQSEKGLDELAEQGKVFPLIGLRDFIAESEGVVEIGENVLNRRDLDQLDAALEVQIKAAVI